MNPSKRIDCHAQADDTRAALNAVQAGIVSNELNKTHIVLEADEAGHLQAIGPYVDGYQAQAAAEAMTELGEDGREQGEPPVSFRAVVLCSG